MMPPMFESPPLTTPGLFVTGTGTDVGKTTVACAILTAWRDQNRRVRLGVCKPFSSGCGRDREGLLSEDAQSLARAGGCAAPRSVVSPVCYAPPVAPAVAAEAEDRGPDWAAVSAALTALDRDHDALLVEGVGGARVPLDPAYPRFMVAEFARALAYPVLVVADAGLGTLNHTLLTVECLTNLGCRVVGLVLNDRTPGDDGADPSRRTNPRWLERLTGVKVLAHVPAGRSMTPGSGTPDARVVAAVSGVDWSQVVRPPGA